MCDVKGVANCDEPPENRCQTLLVPSAFLSVAHCFGFIVHRHSVSPPSQRRRQPLFQPQQASVERKKLR